MSIKWLLSPWITMLLLQATLAGVLLGKKMWRKFPLFVCYAISNFLESTGLYVIYRSQLSHQVYFEIYWIWEAIGLFLGLAVVYEIFNHVFAPYPALGRLAKQSFQGVIVFLVALGSLVAYLQPIGERNHIQGIFLAMEQATRILEVGMLLFLFMFASAFGLRWREYVFGIALGLGIFVTSALVAVTMRAQFGIAASSIVNIIRSVSFNASMFIWIAYVLAPDLAAKQAEMPKRSQLEQWNRAVMELIYQ